jgi:predicted Fe-Mo cluster-binding NifX family protein
MKIAVTSQNFRTVTGHAGKTRRFLVYKAVDGGPAVELARYDLPLEMSMHEFPGGRHPLDEMDVVITGSAGAGFIRNLAQRGVQVATTPESDPAQAVADFLAGKLQPLSPEAQGPHPCGCRH